MGRGRDKRRAAKGKGTGKSGRRQTSPSANLNGHGSIGLMSVAFMRALVGKGLVSGDEILRQVNWLSGSTGRPGKDGDRESEAAMLKALCPLEALQDLQCQRLECLKLEVKELLDDLRKSADPAAHELIGIHRQIQNGSGIGSTEQGQALLEHIEERLRRRGADLVLPTVGSTFDALEHEMVASVNTSKKHQDRRIIAVVGSGFKWRHTGIVGFKALVQVALFRKDEADRKE